MAENTSTAAVTAAVGATTLESRIAAARSMTDVQGGKTPAKTVKTAPKQEVVANYAEDTDDSDDDAASASGEDANGDEDSSSTDDAGNADASGAVAGVDAAKGLELLMAGDMAGALKALGGDPKAADTSDRKFRALREKEEKLDRKEKNRAIAQKNAIAELTKMSTEAQTALTAFRRENNFLKATRDAVSSKNWPEVAKGLAALTQMDLATLTQKLASGRVGPTPEDKRLEDERAKLAKEKSDFEAAKKGETIKKTDAEQRTAALKTLNEKLTGHPFLKVSKGHESRAQKRLEKTLDLWVSSWDGKRYTKTPTDCANELQRDLQEESKASGFTPVVAKNKKPKTGEEPPRSTKPGNKVDLVDINAKNFDDRVARARRMSSINNR